MYLVTSSDNDKKEKKLNDLLRQYNALRTSIPTPVTENIEASKRNVEELESHLKQMHESLISQTSAITDQSMRGIDLLGEIQGFIIESRKKAEQGTPSEDPTKENHKINLKDNEAFGFALYSGATARPPSDDLAPIVNKQLDIIRYLLDKLYEAKPTAVVAIERESITSAPQVAVINRPASATSTSNNDDLFAVSPAITAEVPGSIETQGFRFVFQGYTNSLRKFLNAIAAFELPIVVREVQVKSIEAVAVIGNSRTNRTATPQNAEDIFNALFGGANASNNQPTEAETTPSKFEPVVQDILSEFTVILEYIDIVESTQEGKEEM